MNAKQLMPEVGDNERKMVLRELRKLMPDRAGLEPEGDMIINPDWVVGYNTALIAMTTILEEFFK